MYKFYNANVLNRFEDDCTIRAISCATEKSWDYVYDYLSDAAQREGTLLDKRDFIINYLDKNYKRVYDLPSMSVGQVSGMFPNNTVLISMQGHITCSKPTVNGPTIYDTFDCRDRQAEFVWLVN